MGRFGIEFSDQSNTPFKITKKKHYGSVMSSPERFESDGPFQKTLAWTSYYVLVFVALCVFNKPAMADLIGGHASSPMAIEQSAPIIDPLWALRSTSAEK